MLLAIDCGNTNIVNAIYDQAGVKLFQWRLNSDVQRSGDEYLRSLRQILAENKQDNVVITDCVMASVVPEITPHLVDFCENGLGLTPMIAGAENMAQHLDIQMDAPAQVGADRLVNALAAAHKNMLPAIVLDFGTATTFDIVLPPEPDSRYKAIYAGGVIAPGVHLSVEALVAAAAKLPAIQIESWEASLPIIGKSTQSAMRSGISWGYVGLIEGVVGRIKAHYGVGMHVIATGGLAYLFATHINQIEVIDEHLTTDGLYLLFHTNIKNG